MTQPPPPNGDPTSWQGPPQYGSTGQGGFAPQPGYPQPGYPQQGYSQQVLHVDPPKKKRGGCMKVGLIALGVLVALGVIIGASGGGDDPATVTSDGASSEASNDVADADSASSGIPFMGKTDRDTGAVAGETITRDDIAITATPLEAFPSNGYSEAQLCTTVTFQNNSDSQESFGSYDWSMQDPNGTSRSSSFMNPSSAPDLSMGEVAPGGQVSGAICFDGSAAAIPGEYVLLYTGNIFSSKRLGWVNQL